MYYKKYVALFVFLSVLGSAQALDVPRGSIYRWVDAKGVVHYGDRPAQMGDNPRSEVVLNKSDLSSGDDLPAQRQLAVGLRDDAQKTREAQEKALADKAAADKAIELQKICKTMEESVRTLSMGGRIASVNDKGERSVLSEEDVKQKLDEVNKSLAESCSPKK